MIVIVEGWDGAGKTTLIQQLQADMNLELSPQLVPPGTLEQAQQQHERFIRADREASIMDRCTCISEPIYQLMSVRQCMYTPYWRALQLYRDVKVVFCIAEPDLTKLEPKPHKSQELVEYVKDNAEAIHEKYKEMIGALTATEAQVFLYDWRDKKAYNKLLKFIRG